MFNVFWQLCGSVALKNSDLDASALDRVEQWLKWQRKCINERGPTYITFRDPHGGMVRSARALAIYDQGRFWIDQGPDVKLHYSLSSIRCMMYCLVFVAIVFLFCAIDNGPVSGLKVAAGMFSWLYGMNILLALIRVPYAIRRGVTAGESNDR